MFMEFCNLMVHVLGKIKYILIYYVLGAKSIIHDFLYKKYNHVGKWISLEVFELVAGVLHFVELCHWNFLTARRRVNGFEEMFDGFVRLKCGVADDTYEW